MTRREPSRFRCRSLTHVFIPARASLASLRGSRLAKFRECRPLMVRSAEGKLKNLCPCCPELFLDRGTGCEGDEAFNNCPVSRDRRFLTALSGPFASVGIPLGSRLVRRDTARYSENCGPRSRVTEYAGNGVQPIARVPESGRQDGRSPSATVAATVRSEYWGRFVSVDVA
jgi:hypothetical protein